MDPFLTLDQAYFRAAEADPDLSREAFLEQASRHIAEGALPASGRPFSETWARDGLLVFGEDVDDLKIIPRANKTEALERVSISPLSMADYRLIFADGPEVDCQVVRETGEYGDLDGWKDIRIAARDVDRLWPRAAASPDEIAPRASYAAGKRTKILLEKCFGRDIPPAVDVPNSKLVRLLEAKCVELFKGEPIPDRKTMLRHAGRSSKHG